MRSNFVMIVPLVMGWGWRGINNTFSLSLKG